MKRKLLLLLSIAIACFGFINAQSSIAVKTQETIKAAINGDAKAQNDFCEMLYYDLFDKASLTADAVSKVQKLANEGQAWAQDIMGEVCYSGLAGFTKDEAKAQEWFQKAANQGYAWGITTCGTVCRNNKDYDKALEYYRKAADMGHVEALTGLGQLYQEGNGVEKNLGKALEYYRSAADKGSAVSMLYLGFMYFSGDGVEKNIEESKKWLLKAGEAGLSYGFSNLGGLYNMSEDYSKAMEYFRKAADMGNGEAMCQIGLLYDSGKGVAKNIDTANQWYLKAGEAGFSYGYLNLANNYKSAKNYDKAIEYFHKAVEMGNEDAIKEGESSFIYDIAFSYEFDKDYTKALEYYRKAADKGNGSAMNKIGVLYNSGKGVAKNIDTANQWYLKAGEAGESYGYYNLANNYKSAKNYDKAIEYFHKAVEMGNEVAIEGEASFINDIGDKYQRDKDYTKALEYYRKAADKGNGSAMNKIGVLYNSGKGVAKNIDTANQWYLKAGEAGSSYGYYNLAHNFRHKDESKALEYYRKAAEMGNTDAMVLTGYMYYWGNGVTQNIETANQWYLKAGEAGSSDGYYYLADSYNSNKNYSKAMEYFRKAADMWNVGAMSQIGILYNFGLGVTKNIDKAQEWCLKASEATKAPNMKMFYNTLQNSTLVARSQSRQDVPSIHDSRLDATLRKFVETEEDKEYAEKIINYVYNNYGTYLGCAILQHIIDCELMSAFLNAKTYILTKNGVNPEFGKKIEEFGPDFYRSVTRYADNIQNDNYNPNIFNTLKFDSKPKADEVIKILDDMAKNNKVFREDEIHSYIYSEYLIFTNSYTKEKLNGNSNVDTQTLSDIIAYKIFYFDKLMFLQSLDESGISYSRDHFEHGNKYIRDYFEKWMDSVNPEKK